MRRIVRKIEAPIYLLIIASYCVQFGQYGTAIFLSGASLIRLWINHEND